MPGAGADSPSIMSNMGGSTQSHDPGANGHRTSGSLKLAAGASRRAPASQGWRGLVARARPVMKLPEELITAPAAVAGAAPQPRNLHTSTSSSSCASVAAPPKEAQQGAGLSRIPSLSDIQDNWPQLVMPGARVVAAGAEASGVASPAPPTSRATQVAPPVLANGSFKGSDGAFPALSSGGGPLRSPSRAAGSSGGGDLSSQLAAAAQAAAAGAGTTAGLVHSRRPSAVTTNSTPTVLGPASPQGLASQATQDADGSFAGSSHSAANRTVGALKAPFGKPPLPQATQQHVASALAATARGSTGASWRHVRSSSTNSVKELGVGGASSSLFGGIRHRGGVSLELIAFAIGGNAVEPAPGTSTALPSPRAGGSKPQKLGTRLGSWGGWGS